MNPYTDEVEYTKRVVYIEYHDIYGKAHTIRSVKLTLEKEIYYLTEGGFVQIQRDNRQFVAASGDMHTIREIMKETDDLGNDTFTLKLWYGDEVKFQINYACIAAGKRSFLYYSGEPEFL